MKPNYSRLLHILSWKRPSASTDERDFCTWIKEQVPADKADVDKYGNLWVTVGDHPQTMFSSHTDTVHRTGGRQRLAYDETKHHLFPAKGGDECLGADDGTGVWLMLHMIDAGVKGLYVFHRDEEIGGAGSRFIADKLAQRLEGVKHCVAFDRKGYTDIITTQGGTRTCSDEFARALAAELNIHGVPNMGPSPHGSFTDSKNYRKIISECTNLSVGYFNQHTANEYQDVDFAGKLAHALIHVNWESLPAVRSTVDVEPPKQPPLFEFNFNRQGNPLDIPTRDELLVWVRENPLAAIELLNGLMITKGDMLDAEYDARRRAARDKTMVVQHPQQVRNVPAGGKKANHRQATEESQSCSRPWKPNPRKH